ncbi:DUF1648 domain-containing protein [Ethanoligenens sp.]|uniref:DUF1648 domain-containing protein n=1 Tax=Ethanoligenens sp. TaxID=2099655 RepID=UPI0039ECA9DB
MKTKNTRLQNVLQWVGILLLIGQFVYTAMMWLLLPARIPAHYDLSNHVTRWGSRNELFIVPIITVGIYAFLTVLERMPASWNFSIETNDRNRAYLHSAYRTILIISKLCVEVTFFIITICMATAQIALIWLDCIPVAILLIFVAFYISHVSRKAKRLAHPYDND